MKKSHAVGLALVTFMVSSIVSAQPEVELVTFSGNIGDRVINIKGRGFGVTGPNIILYETFSSGKEGDPILSGKPERGQWSSSPGASIPRYKQGLSGLGHGVRDYNFTNGNKQAQLQVEFGGRYDEIFIAYNVHVPPGKFFPGADQDETFPPLSSWKLSWLLDGPNAFQEQTEYDMVIPTHAGRGSAIIGGNDGNLTWLDSFSAWWSWHGNNQFSFWQAANADSGAYNFTVVNDRGLYSKQSNSKNLFPEGTSNKFDRINFPGWFGNGNWSNFDAVYDNVYVAVGSGARARVELVDSSDYSAATSIVVLDIGEWSETGLVAKYYGTEEIADKYIFVTSSNGKRNLVGKPGCLKCPMPPLGSIE